MTAQRTAEKPLAPQNGQRAYRVDATRVSEVVVVGTGVAGLAAALGSSPRAVTVLTKERLGRSGSSAWAQGGVAVALGEDDSPDLHAADTLAVAGGLGDPAVVGLLTQEGPVRIGELIELGARFDRATPQDGSEAGRPLDPDATHAGEPAAASVPAVAAANDGEALALGREAAHSRRRILHAGGDATGAELVRALTAAVVEAPGVRVEEDCFALDLAVEALPEGRRRVAGVVALHADGRRVLHLAGAVVLATGGLGQLFAHTTNPVEVTGDGLAMAARAGVRLVDLEMVQFHPTALAAEVDADAAAGGPLPLLTEALRGEGAVLLDGAGHRFMLDEHPDAELAPRDVVARAIHRRREIGDQVFLDARQAVGERFPERFPTVFEKAMAAGIDPRVEPMPVTPAAHYHMGGIATDDRGRSSLPGLWVCGEAASTGAHGANRLASNSLLEALVFGARVAEDTARRLAVLPAGDAAGLARLRVAGRGVERGAGAGASDGVPRIDDRPNLQRRLHELRAAVRRVAWSRVGLLRDAAGLLAATDEFSDLEREAVDLAAAVEAAGAAVPFADRVRWGETRNLILAGRLVTAAALARRESRGAHTRLDWPQADPGWRRHLYAEVEPGGATQAAAFRLRTGPLLPEADRVLEAGVARKGQRATEPRRAEALPPGARSAETRPAGPRLAEPRPSTAPGSAAPSLSEEPRWPRVPPTIAAWGGPR